MRANKAFAQNIQFNSEGTGHCVGRSFSFLVMAFPLGLLADVPLSSLVGLRAAGRDPRADLNANDAYSAFEASADLFLSGATGTNVNDFRAIIVR